MAQFLSLVIYQEKQCEEENLQLEEVDKATVTHSSLEQILKVLWFCLAFKVNQSRHRAHHILPFLEVMD